MIDYSKLNPEQKTAVFSDNPRILCLAGAGTGKTQVLTRRVARLYESGIPAGNMLALTFTRAAGAEMKERVISLIGKDGEQLFCNTFHAFCVQVIRDEENAFAIGYSPNFTILDQEEQSELLAEVIADLKIDVTAAQINQIRSGKTESMNPVTRKQAQTALKEYKSRLRDNNAFDFDSLIEYTLEIFENPETAARYRRQFKHIFVDEFQDTDPAQWALVNKIAPENLFVVGDDFQSIYGFRGSDISIILGLASDPQWETVKLEANYRCTQQIVAAANTLIKYNNQTEKKLIAQKTGVPIAFYTPDDDESEITNLADFFRDSIAKKQTTAIIARTNKQLANARAILRGLEIPCTNPSENKEVLSDAATKQLMAWIDALENPADFAVKKVAAFKISHDIINRIEAQQLDSYGGTFLEFAEATAAGAEFVDVFQDAMLEYEELIEQESAPSEIIDRLAEFLQISDTQSLYNTARDWEERQWILKEPATMQAFLEWARIHAVSEKSADTIKPDKIHLMTAHGSKGLEFENVVIIGACQGIFPNKGDIEEERRLFYVAMTRAREFLAISSPKCVTTWSGDKKQTQISQFISETESE